MNYLLDTHTFLWASFSPAKLSAKAAKVIRAADHRIYLSTVSFWEVSLKYGLGKIELENCTPEGLPNLATQMGFEIIQPTAQESASSYQLPKTHHKDPFDRMIVWQAIRQSMVLISKDSKLPEYERFGLKVFW